MDERWATLRVSNNVFEIITQGRDIAPAIQWVLDPYFIEPGREYRITIIPTNDVGARVFSKPPEAHISVGDPEQPGLGDPSPNIIRGNWSQSSGEDIRQVRSTPGVESNGGRIVERGGSGEGESEEAGGSVEFHDPEYVISDSGLRIGIEKFLRAKERGSLWMDWEIVIPARRALAAEWLYKVVREVIGEGIDDDNN